MTILVVSLSSLHSNLSHAFQPPKVESFQFTPNDLDLTSVETKVDFELVVSHPSGVENISTLLTLTNANGDTLVTYLTRSDNPINFSLSKVTFKGMLIVPRNIATGVYNLKAAEIRNNSSAGYQYSTDIIQPGKIRNLPGAESGLLIRNGGDLNLNYDTFVGPTYEGYRAPIFLDTLNYNSSKVPVWKVGETFDPSKYYELRVPTLQLRVESKTISTCSTDGSLLKLIKEGTCSFIVFTNKSKDYIKKESNQTVTISSARAKPQLTMQAIPDQNIKNIPKSIEIFRVYTAAQGWIFPTSATPRVCVANGFYVNLIGGGTCELIFQTSETSEYLASDLYKVNFEVVRDAQTISFSPPATVNLSAKTLALSATASSGGVITYQTTSTGICSITGSTLNLLKGGNCAITATQAGTATLAPISTTATVMIAGSIVPTKKTISCVKGNKTKKVSGTNPKCPKGYKIKR
jgi:hypothetical protein